MKTVVCLLVIVAFTANAIAQKPNEIIVPAGEYPGKVIPREQQFRYQEFREGRAFFENGKPSAALPFNYSFLTGEWQFIEKGDTVAVMDSAIFPMIQVGDDQFYRDKNEGYLEVLAGNEMVKLARQQKWIITRKDSKVNNGYGEYTDATTGTRATKYSSSMAKVIRNEDMIWELKGNYWLMEGQNQVSRCTMRSFSKLFPARKEFIKSFVKQEGIDFDVEGDLKKLLAYCLR